MIDDPLVTSELPPLHFPIPQTTKELLLSSGSSAGYHAVSSYIGCPERSRLRSLGMRRKPRMIDLDDDLPKPLTNLDYGQLIHALLGTRIVYGQAAAERMVTRPAEVDVTPDAPSRPLLLLAEDRAQAMLSIRTYDATYPMESEPWLYIGVESEVYANIGTLDEPIYRTARYDAVVQQLDPIRGKIVYSLEHKTSARGGAMREYTPQAMVQVALWNNCPGLVERYGPMVGVIFDVIVKTNIPRCERLAPRYISRMQVERALDYLRLPARIQYPMAADGSYPRLINECYGRFSPCDYVDLCLEGAHGEYEIVQLTKAKE